MKNYPLKTFAIASAISVFVFSSCRKEIAPDLEKNIANIQSSAAQAPHPIHPKWSTYMAKIKTKNAGFLKTDEYYKKFFSDAQNGAEPGDCKATTLNAVIEGYFNEF